MLVVLIFSILVLVIPGLFAVDLSYYDPMLPKGFSGLLKAMPMLFFSYAGFETLAQVAGETKNPTKNAANDICKRLYWLPYSFSSLWLL